MVLSITQIQLNFISTTKVLFQILKDNGFDLLLAHVQSICTQYEIDVPHINASYKRLQVVHVSNKN
jgi:hypothetical protein